MHAVREDPKRKGLLHAGTESGVMMSFDDGGHWQPVQLNLPPVPVHDRVVKNGDLVAATHGRSFWILDDLTPAREMDAQAAADSVHLFKPSVAYIGMPGGFEPRGPVGQNPPAGAVIYASYGTCTIEPAAKVPGSSHWGGSGDGPETLPGNYQVRVTVEGKSYSAPLEVKNDPRLSISEADLKKRFDLALKIRDRLDADHRAVLDTRKVHAQIGDLKVKLRDDPKSKEITDAADALDKKMTAVEEKLMQTKAKSSEDPLNYPIKLDDKLSALGSAVESGDGAPTEQTYTVFDLLNHELDEVLGAWRDIPEQDLVALNELARKADVPTVSVP